MLSQGYRKLHRECASPKNSIEVILGSSRIGGSEKFVGLRQGRLGTCAVVCGLQSRGLGFVKPGLGLRTTFGVIWVVVKIMVLFWIPIIIRHLIFWVPKKGDPNFDIPPYMYTYRERHHQGLLGLNVSEHFFLSWIKSVFVTGLLLRNLN